LTVRSNGQVEGQVTRVKLIKRMMYGKAGFAHLASTGFAPNLKTRREPRTTDVSCSSPNRDRFPSFLLSLPLSTCWYMTRPVWADLARKRETLPRVAAAAGHMFLEKPLLIWLLSLRFCTLGRNKSPWS